MSTRQLSSAPIQQPQLSVVIIKPSTGWVSPRLREFWEYRELLHFLIWRDVKVRYKQTALGVSWAIIQPVFTMLVFAVFFGRLGKIPSDGIPFPTVAYAAPVPWTFFARAWPRPPTAWWEAPTCSRRCTSLA